MLSVTINKVAGLESIEQVVSVIENHGVLNINHEDTDWPGEDTLIRRINIINVPDRINYAPLIKGVKSKFVYAHAYSEKPKRKKSWFEENEILVPKEERVNAVRADILFFEYNGSIFAAFFTHAERTLARLKEELLLQLYWGEIIPAVDFEVDDDILYWLVYRKVQCGGSINKNFDIAGISAYLGYSTLETHKMSGEGDRIYELLGTMAFIFGNEPLDSLHLLLRRATENCSFRFYRSGAIKIAENEYLGNYCGNHADKAFAARLCLLIYTEVIPPMVQEYNQHKLDGSWSAKQRQSFVNEVGKGILKKVIPSLGLSSTMTVTEILAS